MILRALAIALLLCPAGRSRSGGDREEQGAAGQDSNDDETVHGAHLCA